MEDHTRSSPAEYIALLDDRGTVVGVTDSSGTVLERLYYNSTGLLKVHAGDDSPTGAHRSAHIPFGWTGLYKEPFTGKYHTHYRDYDPLHSRWLSEDPAGYMDGLNLYHAYMGVNGEDPLGLEVQWHHLLSKAIFGKDGLINAAELGIDIDSAEFGWILDRLDHTGKEVSLHSLGWNRDWDRWVNRELEAGRPITKDSVLHKLESMKTQYRDVLRRGFPAFTSYRSTVWKAFEKGGDIRNVFLAAAKANADGKWWLESLKSNAKYTSFKTPSNTRKLVRGLKILDIAALTFALASAESQAEQNRIIADSMDPLFATEMGDSTIKFNQPEDRGTATYHLVRRSRYYLPRTYVTPGVSPADVDGPGIIIRTVSLQTTRIEAFQLGGVLNTTVPQATMVEKGDELPIPALVWYEWVTGFQMYQPQP